MIGSLPGAQGFQCDVTKDEEIDRVFQQIGEKYNGKIHTLVHSVAFAPADDLKNDFLLTSREGFRVAHDISVYSLIALARGAAPLMTEGGSIITLTFYGSEKVMLGYNVMGVAKAALEASVRYLAASLGPKNIRVNAISAGPIKTLAARGIGSLGEILKFVSERAPLKRSVATTEVGDTAAFLASDGASGITGEVLHVDCGYHVMGF
jgi:enoyl-[acyl-carrier protein] reductase I